MSGIRAVVCDLGGVIIRIDPDRIRRRWAERSPLPASEVAAAYPDAAYEAFERDELTPEQYLSHVRDRLQLEGDDAALTADFNALYLGADAEVVALLAELRAADLPLIALTNTNRLHHRVWSHRFRRELEVFTAVHSSHDLRARKPEQQAYARVLHAHDLEARSVVFVDDLQRNVAAAQEMGMRGVLFTGAGPLRRELVRHGLMAP